MSPASYSHRVHSTSLDVENYPKIEINTFKCANGLELTFITDNKGLPHTLEHLIFCGSESHPERGYLDRLAGLCQSQGTNAYTSDDHTCYTFLTSSLSGLLNLLPVFLDHIFRPTLDESVVRREVFHRASGGGRGVVYCEMGGREWSEQDQLDLALRRGTVKGDGTVYGWECGGRTKDIAQLKLEEIKNYHAHYYRPENVCVVLAGGKIEGELESILSILESVKFLPQQPIPLPITPAIIEKQQSTMIKFPANDESLGSVGFAWPGPPSDEIYTITALHVLFRMLKDTSASPLYQHFVERSDPIASDIDYEVKPMYETMLSLIFSGVSTDEQFLHKGMLWEELKNVLEDIRKDVETLDERRLVALKSLNIKLQESLEDDPHDICASYCMPEIVRSKWPFSKDQGRTSLGKYGEAITKMPVYLKELESQPMSFWLDLMDKYLLSVRPTEVCMLPSRQTNEDIKKWETDQLEGIPIIELPNDEYKSTTEIPPFSCGKLAEIKCQIQNPSPLIQIVTNPNCGVKRLTLAFEIAKNVPESLWTYLVLLQELFFQSDLQITDDLLEKYNPPVLTKATTIQYQELIEILSGVFSTFESSVGFDNEIFSCGYFDSHFIISLHGRVDFDLSQLRNLALMVMEATVFTSDRITEVLENLISQLKDTWGEAHSVLDTVLTTKLEECHQKGIKRPRNNATTMIEPILGLVPQTQFLVKLRKQMEKDPEAVISDLEKIRDYLLKSQMLVHFGTNSDKESPTEKMTNEATHSFWENLSYSLPRHGVLEGSTINDAGSFELIPMSDITSSYASITIPLNILPRSKSYSDKEIDNLLVTALLCQLLSYTEGPLFRRIRGAGLAYGASLSMAIWSGLITLSLDDSSDPVRALHTFHALLQELAASPETIVTKEAIRAAQSGMLFQFVMERATPAGLVATSCRSALRGLPSVGGLEEKRWNERMLNIDHNLLMEAVKGLLPTFMNFGLGIRLMAVPASKLDEIKNDLDNIKIPFYVNNIVDLAHLLN